MNLYCSFVIHPVTYSPLSFLPNLNMLIDSIDLPKHPNYLDSLTRIKVTGLTLEQNRELNFLVCLILKTFAVIWR